MTPLKKGFICGLQGIGLISIYEIDKHNKITLVQNLKVKGDNRLNDIVRISLLHASPDNVQVSMTVLFSSDKDKSH